MVIRQARVDEDHTALRGLWGEYLAWVNAELDERYGINFPIEEVLERNLADLSAFAPPAGRLLLAFDSGRPIGIACLHALSDEVGEVKRMYVQPSARGSGVGRQLLTGLLMGAREVGYRRVCLDSARFMNAAHGLYRSNGFVDIEPYKQSEIPPEFWPYWVFMELDLDQASVD